MIPTMRLPLRPVGVACMCLVLVLACLGPCAPVTVTADTPSRPQRAPSLRMASPPDWAAAKGAADHPKLAQPLALLRAHGASQPPAEGVTGLRLHNGASRCASPVMPQTSRPWSGASPRAGVR